MQKKTGQRIQLGIFITLAIVIFSVAIYFIGNKQNIFGSFFRLEANFNQVSGLRAGSNVRLMGVTVGTVEAVNIINDTSIQVVMLIEDDSRRFIRKNSVASIGSDGLVGERVVDIEPGTSDVKLVSPRDNIPTRSQVQTDELLRTLNSTNENASTLVNNLVKISEEIYSGEGALGMLLQDAAMADQLRQTAVNLNTTSQESIQLMKELQNSISLIQEGQGMLSTILTDTSWVYTVDQALGQVEQTTIRLETTASELEKLSTKLNDPEGPLGTVLEDTAVAADIKAIMDNLDEGTARFSENMKALRSNFLFRKYFKKKAKREEKAE